MNGADGGAAKRAGREPPVFIVGCGRSGTTLLRMMLNAHPQLAIPSESHFIYALARLRAAGRIGSDLSRPAEWQELLAFINSYRYFDWWPVPRTRVVERLDGLEQRSYGAVFRTLFEQFREQERKQRWGDKTPMYVNYMLLVEHFFPEAKFVHVIRDGRDVAMSLLTRSWGPRRIEYAGYYWKWLVLIGMVCGRILGPERYRELRYEDLVMDPEGNLRDLCAWLALDFDPSMLDYHASEAAQSYATYGSGSHRLAEPLDPKLLYKWRGKMERRDAASIVRQAGAILSLFDYEVADFNQRWRNDLARIETLLHPDMLARIEPSTLARAAGPFRQRCGLQIHRGNQLLSFALGDYGRWARNGLQWQRTVANMLD